MGDPATTFSLGQVALKCRICAHDRFLIRSEKRSLFPVTQSDVMRGESYLITVAVCERCTFVHEFAQPR